MRVRAAMERADSIVQNFGRVVRALREERGFSLRELARRAGISDVYVGCVERGKSPPGLRALEGLARALDVTLSELFSQVEGAAAHGGEPPPTLDLRTWKRLQRELPPLVDYINRVVTQAGVERPRYRRAKR